MIINSKHVIHYCFVTLVIQRHQHIFSFSEQIPALQVAADHQWRKMIITSLQLCYDLLLHHTICVTRLREKDFRHLPIMV